YETVEGVADFHSLRAYYVTALVRSGASIKEVHTLARHAKEETTLKHYAKVSAHDLHAAVGCLPVPTVGSRQPEALAATGTDPAPAATSCASLANVNGYNSLTEQAVTPNVLMFANPLASQSGLRVSNPLLSAPCRCAPPESQESFDPRLELG